MAESATDEAREAERVTRELCAVAAEALDREDLRHARQALNAAIDLGIEGHCDLAALAERYETLRLRRLARRRLWSAFEVPAGLAIALPFVGFTVWPSTGTCIALAAGIALGLPILYRSGIALASRRGHGDPPLMPLAETSPPARTARTPAR